MLAYRSRQPRLRSLALQYRGLKLGAGLSGVIMPKETPQDDSANQEHNCP